MNNFAELQELIISRINFAENIVVQATDSFLLTIKQYSNDAIDAAFGKKFRVFIEDVDLNHPHIKQIFIGLDNNLIELLKIADFAVKNRILSNVSNKVVDKFIKTIDSPFNNYRKIRLLPSQAERDRLRNSREINNIDLGVISRRGKEIWETQPDDFIGFVRFNLPYQDILLLADKKIARYDSLGCSGLAAQIRESINDFTNKVHNVYYGFNKITMTNASVILAKCLNYELSNVIAKEGHVYEPRAYPLYMLSRLASATVMRIVNFLEYYPEIGGKAIFDSFTVLVPSYHGKEIDEDIVDIKEKKITPILLGECDNKCFFICFFM